MCTKQKLINADRLANAIEEFFQHLQTVKTPYEELHDDADVSWQIIINRMSLHDVDETFDKLANALNAYDFQDYTDDPTPIG